jgi:hypothetical protein
MVRPQSPIVIIRRHLAINTALVHSFLHTARYTSGQRTLARRRTRSGNRRWISLRPSWRTITRILSTCCNERRRRGRSRCVGRRHRTPSGLSGPARWVREMCPWDRRSLRCGKSDASTRSPTSTVSPLPPSPPISKVLVRFHPIVTICCGPHYREGSLTEERNISHCRRQRQRSLGL